MNISSSHLSPSELRELHPEGGKKSIKVGGDRGPKESYVLETNWGNPIWAHRDWSSGHVACRHLHQVLRAYMHMCVCTHACMCVYKMVSQFSVFMKFLSVRTSGSLILVLSLGLFFFSWFFLFNFDIIFFVLSHYILFWYILLLFLRSRSSQW